MPDDHDRTPAAEYNVQDGMMLALSYLRDPSDVACPECGRGQMEVVCYLDVASVETGTAIFTSPDGPYMVVLYCHGCRRAGAVDLSDTSAAR